MRVIIAGSRGLLLSPWAIDAALEEAQWKPTTIVSGGAVGPDRAGEAWVRAKAPPVGEQSSSAGPHQGRTSSVTMHSYRGGGILAGLSIVRFIPDWRRHGKRAGILRNYEMATFADALLAFWDGKSNGTRHMIHAMTILEKPLKVVMMPAEPERNNNGGA